MNKCQNSQEYIRSAESPHHFLIATILNTKSSRWTLLAWLCIQVPIKLTATAHGAQRSTRAKALQNVTLLTARSPVPPQSRTQKGLASLLAQNTFHLKNDGPEVCLSAAVVKFSQAAQPFSCFFPVASGSASGNARTLVRLHGFSHHPLACSNT